MHLPNVRLAPPVDRKQTRTDRYLNATSAGFGRFLKIEYD